MTKSVNPSTTDFKLHPQLAADSLAVTRLALSDVLLINDSRYVWCLLVPRISGARDWTDIPVELKPAFNAEIDRVCRAVQQYADAYKMNVASLGNMVDQLHIHVIARQPNDAAWPGPIWGVGQTQPYVAEDAAKVVATLKQLLADHTEDEPSDGESS